MARADAVRKGIRLEELTVGWMVIEAVVAIGAGIAARSVLLTAFGVDSVIELLSGVILYRRLKGDSEKLEATAIGISAVLLVLLCVYVLVSSLTGLLLRVEPSVSVVGIAVSAVALVAMPLLARAKRLVNVVLQSPSLRADIAETVSCAYLAAVTLAGLVVAALTGWWWIQYVAALVLLGWLVPETREALEEWRHNWGQQWGSGAMSSSSSDDSGQDVNAEPRHHHEKRRLMVTQLLHAPVLNPAGTEVGRAEDFIVKLSDGSYPPVTGLKVRVGAQDVFIGKDLIERLEPNGVRLNTPTIRTEPFQRRPGEVLLAADVLGRHLMDVNKGRIVQAHDLVLAPGDDGWHLAGIDRSPQAMIRRLVPRRGRPDLRRHSILDWKDVQPFVSHVPTARLRLPLQRLRRLHPAQIADIVEGASHEEGQEIIEAVEGDPAFTADVFEELDPEHQVEFIRSKSNEDAARILERMAPDDAADLLGELNQERRKPVFDMMAPTQQHKLRKLLQYHPTTAGGMMSPDYVWVIRGATVDMALEAVRIDDKTPRPLQNTVFVTEADGRFVGSIGVVELLRSERVIRIEELELVNCFVHGNADFADVALMMADYNLTALAVTDAAENLIGAISSDDVIEALVPDGWRARIEASTGV